MATKSPEPPRCGHCEPIGAAEIAPIVGRQETYVRKMLSEGKLPEPRGKLGSSYWWWRHDIEAWARETGRIRLVSPAEAGELIETVQRWLAAPATTPEATDSDPTPSGGVPRS